MHSLLLISAIIAFLLFLRFLRVLTRIFQRPPAPSSQIRNLFPLQEKPIRVLCLGDSITQGDLGENYVKRLASRFDREKVRFVSGGVNGDLAETLSGRLDAALAVKPQAAILLIGTNNLHALMDPAHTRTYLKQGKIDSPTSPERYREHVGLILKRLKEAGVQSVAVYSIPLISTDLDHPVNQLGNRLTDLLRGEVEKMGAHWLPLRESQKEYLNKVPSPSRWPYEMFQFLLFRSLMLRTIGLSWDAVARGVGNPFSFDHLHSTTRMATLMADLAENFIRKQMGSARGNAREP